MCQECRGAGRFPDRIDWQRQTSPLFCLVDNELNYENENNSVNGIRNKEAELGRCSVERQDTPDLHPATVTKTKIETKNEEEKETKIRKPLERLEHGL